jgi:signal transduction histidine kinase
MLYRNAARAFQPSEIRLAQAIATHVAQSVVRVQREHELARAYRVEREAHLEAEEATRAREEILSVVSHDLRNPLGTILMGSSTLRDALDPADSRTQRIATVAERIQRQAERMARLIEDLVDFSGIQAGKLAIARTPQAPSALIETTRDLFKPIASERGVVFEASAVTALPVVDCDAERVVQIFGNLVGNAIKVTPRGGSIEIGAAPSDGDHVVFFVRDTGPGIAADELPSLFERYWRSKAAHYKGAGLGLSIARGLVEAHGGRIWVESQVGRGSTFFFSLTSTRN